MTALKTVPPSQGEVCILLGLCQGAEYLEAQLNSYLAQTYQDWSLIASDDGSTDGSPDIVEQFARTCPEHRIECHPGPARGFVRNFLSLLQRVPRDARFAALSDQDDVWFPDKLARAVHALSQLPSEQPGLYCARTLICDARLNPLGPSPLFRSPPSFRNALVQSIGSGNTMVLNRRALDLAAQLAERVPDPVAHDWWLYQVITGHGGTVLRDEDPVLLYRQHGRNLIGANLAARQRLSRLQALLGGRFREWMETNLAALEGISSEFTPDARAVLAQFRAARQGPLPTRLRALRACGVYRQGRLGNIALRLACILNRL